MADKLSFMAVLNMSTDECLQFLEAQRWPDGIACPDCGTLDPYRIERKKASKNGVRFLWKCRGCKRQFTATVGTIFEGSHIPLNKWFAAIWLMTASKKGISAHQIHRQLDVTYKSAWFLMHRIRSAMKEGGSPFLAGVVEADETYVGGKYHKSPRAVRMHSKPGRPDAQSNKTTVFGILERGGRVRTQVVPDAKRETLEPILLAGLDPQRSHLMTDEWQAYNRIRQHVPHDVIRHVSEYVRGEVHTNGIENYWSVLKRGLYGTYQHVDRGYLGQYLDEFSFRFNRRKVSDGERFLSLVQESAAHPRVRWYFRDEPSPEA